MKTFQFWFWDVPCWKNQAWHITIRLLDHAHAESLAAQLSKDNLSGIGTRVEVTDDKGLACRWRDGVKAITTKDEWIHDVGAGYTFDEVKSNGL